MYISTDDVTSMLTENKLIQCAHY